MADNDPEDGPLDRLAADARRRAARATAEATLEVAGEAASKLANGVLDGLESLLFGKVGGAEEAAQKDDGDPLTRLRGRYAAERAASPAPEPAPEEDPVARAREELAALKAARTATPATPDVKKTL